MVEFINLAINERDVVYDGKVKASYHGQGHIRLGDDMLGKRVYIVFPMYRKDTEDGMIVAVDEIRNRGVHSHTHQTTGILLGREYVGRKCIVILQEGV